MYMAEDGRWLVSTHADLYNECAFNGHVVDREHKYQSKRNLWNGHDSGRDNVTILRQETAGDLPRIDQNFVPQRYSGMRRR